MDRLKGKIALIVGATSGIGRSIAARFAEEGAIVVAAGRRQDLGDQLTEELGGLGYEACFVRTDATVEQQVIDLCDTVIARYGRLDIAVNAQGWNRLDRISELTSDVFDKVIKVNLYSMFYCMKQEAAKMTPQNNGVILNVSSINSTVANNYMAAYCAAKAGLDQLTRVAAMELGPSGIRVNTLNPGLTRTELSQGIFADQRLYHAFTDKTPLHMHAEPSDIAAAAVFLASDEAKFISAVSLRVDGGLAPEGFPDVFRIFKNEVW